MDCVIFMIIRNSLIFLNFFEPHCITTLYIPIVKSLERIATIINKHEKHENHASLRYSLPFIIFSL